MHQRPPAPLPGTGLTTPEPNKSHPEMVSGIRRAAVVSKVPMTSLPLGTPSPSTAWLASFSRRSRASANGSSLSPAGVRMTPR